MANACDKCGQFPDSDILLIWVYRQIVPINNYGVSGSEFEQCDLCKAVSSPTRPIQHSADCPMDKVEQFLAYHSASIDSREECNGGISGD